MKVTSRVYVPNASVLSIIFDERSETEKNRDYLMLSRNTPGFFWLGLGKRERLNSFAL